jgi:hypothetical protein
MLQKRPADGRKELLLAIVNAVERTCCHYVDLAKAPESEKNLILNDIRGKVMACHGERLSCQRKACSMSYQTLFKILTTCIAEFKKDVQRKVHFGYLALLIWLCQHVAFEYDDMQITLESILALETTDLCRNQCAICINGETIFITQGLYSIFQSWTQTDTLKSRRKLFPITHDRITDILKRISSTHLKKGVVILPKDLLLPAHVVDNLHCNGALQEQFEYQKAFVSKSSFKKPI